MKKILFLLSTVLVTVDCTASLTEEKSSILDKMLSTILLAKTPEDKKVAEKEFIEKLDKKIDNVKRSQLLKTRGADLLIDAITADSLNTLAALLKYPEVKNRINEKLSQIGTPLEIAIHQGNTPLVELLLTSGADINLPGPADTPPLFLAASLGNFSLADFLLQKGADINSKNTAGLPIFYLAIVLGQPALVKFFIDRKADVIKNLSPLDFAATQDNPNLSIVQLLVDADIKLSILEPEDINNKAIYDIITKKTKFPIDLTTQPFKQEKTRKLTDILHQFTNKPLNPATKKSLEESALNLFDEISDEECKNMLTEGGDLLLISVVLGESLKLVTKLLTYPEVKKVINNLSLTGYAPLHATAKNTSTAIADLLWEAGAKNIDIEAKTGDTPLSLAIEENNIIMTQWFLEKKANVHKTIEVFNKKITPLDLAKEGKNNKIITMLTKATTESPSTPTSNLQALSNALAALAPHKK